jgi:predicted nucleotidyltransferase
MLANHRSAVDRFVAACQADWRIVAAFLGGSNARGEADAHSDLDLCVITTDEAFDDFFADRGAFVRRLGETVFVEDFGLPNIVFFILSDGTEVELHLGSEDHLDRIHSGPFKVLPVALHHGDGARSIVRFFQQLAPALAQAHGIAYPAELERVMTDRLKQLSHD